MEWFFAIAVAYLLYSAIKIAFLACMKPSHMDIRKRIDMLKTDINASVRQEREEMAARLNAEAAELKAMADDEFAKYIEMLNERSNIPCRDWRLLQTEREEEW